MTKVDEEPPEFTSRSIKLSKALSIESRKSGGIFFTPRSIRNNLIDALPASFAPKSILEPSMGTGEFIDDVLSRFPDSTIVGVEMNDTIFNACPDWPIRVSKIHADFLTAQFQDGFDLIIGNPPYFQIKGSQKVKLRKEFSLLDGKFDIYVVFILKSLQLLNPDGILAFVIPCTFINTHSYGRVRQYILENLTVLDIIRFHDTGWFHTKQRTIGLIIQKTPTNHFGDNDAFKFKTTNNLILSDKISVAYLKKCMTGHTIGSKGFKIKTGEVVCTSNRWKSKLTDNSTYPILIHNSNLRNFEFRYEKARGSTRPLHIDCSSYWISEKTIVLNRGNGNNGNFRFECALVDPSDWQVPLIAENHIYKITDNGNNELERLFSILQSEQTREFLNYFIGNGMLTQRAIYDIPF